MAQVHEIIPKDDKQKYREISKTTDEVSPSEIIPEILIIHDPKRYFEKAW